MNSDFKDKLESWVSRSFEVGYNAVGFGPALDFSAIDETILKWMDSRVIASKHLQDEYVKSKMTEQLKKYIGDGLTYNDFRKDINTILDKAGITSIKPHHVETIFRTEAQTALNYGRYNSMADAVDVAPYWEYVFVDDDNHQEGTICYDMASRKRKFIAKADDPIWKSIYPPNHFNCRSGVIAHTAESLKQNKLSVSKKYKGAMPEDGFNGTQFEFREYRQAA